MTDKELLELAAKAAGIELACWDEDGNQWIRANDCTEKITQTGNGFGAAVFDPLTDDGDALRLAVKLKIQPAYLEQGVVFTGYESVRRSFKPIFEELGFDDCAATRRAIVRRAAKIGKGMP